jgi:hypothetical protein
MREVEALREEGRIAGTRVPPGEAHHGSGAGRQVDARREHDRDDLTSGAHAVNPGAESPLDALAIVGLAALAMFAIWRLAARRRQRR